MVPNIDGSASATENNICDTDSDIDYEMLHKIGDQVIVKYEEEFFPSIVNDTNPEGAPVSVMVMSGLGWDWPQNEDELWYSFGNVVQTIRPPEFSDGILWCQQWQIIKNGTIKTDYLPSRLYLHKLLNRQSLISHNPNALYLHIINK